MADIATLPDVAMGGIDDEEDVCRVCRVEGDDEAPLIYPCKCSGSVRFVHPDCLKSWLAHSQKKYCEICGHKYTFTKVYPEHLPDFIPAVVYIRQASLWIFRMGCYAARFWWASTVWLILLPTFNIITLRSLVWLADQLAHPGVGPQRGQGQTQVEFNTTATQTAPAKGLPTELSGQKLALSVVLRGPAGFGAKVLEASWRNWYEGENNTLPVFIFRGQVLSITLAAVLIGFILLREWITQHNWAEHVPRPKEKEAEIDPDEWTIHGGIAYKHEELVEAAKRLREDGVVARIRDSKNNIDQLESNTDVFGILEELPIARTRTRYKIEIPPEKVSDLVDGVHTLNNAGNLSLEAMSADPGSESSSTSTPARRVSFFPTEAPSGPSRHGDTLGSVSTAPTGSPAANDRLSNGTAAENYVAWTSGLTSPGGGPPRPASLPKAAVEVAYTAPELLSEKRKGKARATEQVSGVGDGPQLSVTEPHSIPLPPSPTGSGHYLEDVGQGNLRDVIASSGSSGPPVSPRLVDAPEAAGPDPPDRILPRNTPETEEHLTCAPPPYSPADDAYRDLSSGQRSPSTDSDRTMPASEGSSPNGSPRIAAIAPRDPIVQVDNAPIAVIRDLPANVPLHGDEVDVQFMADDEDDAHWEREDWDGVLEVIGLIGPLGGMIQNVIFANIIMGAALTILVGVPIIIGKVFLTIDGMRSVLYVLRLTLRGVRTITDPIIDVSATIVVKYLISGSTALFRHLGLDHRIHKLYILESLTSSPGQEGSRLRDLLALLGSRSYDAYQVYRVASQRIAYSDQMTDRIWCMLAGYAVGVICVLAVAMAGEAGVGRISTAVSAQVRQHATFLKLAFFMALELVVFPLGIGMVIDACTVPLFAGATLTGRLRHLTVAPFGVLFVSWLIGTLFMFSFANILSHIRTQCRPGAMFFIRDPSDQNYSPVKDIIERPSWSQLRKLGISAIMYMILVFWLVGGTCWTIRYQFFVEILPLRLSDFAPISSVPFDLLFLHLVLPASVDSLRPRHRLKKVWHIYWRYAISAFRLTSLMYGRRRPLEENDDSRLWHILDKPFRLLFGQYEVESTEARVPGADQIVLLPPSERKKGGVFVPVDENGSPRNLDDKIRLLKQDRAAREAGRDPKVDYKVVWLPRFWRTRIHVFILVTLSVVSATLAVLFFIPLLVGRAAMGLVFTEAMHDGYNFITGGYICYFAYASGREVGKRVALSGKAGRLHRSDTSTRFKRVVLNVLSSVYAILALYLVLPIVVGLIFELYVGMYGRYRLRLEVTTVLHLWDAWAMGTIIDSLFVGVTSLVVRRRHRHDHQHQHHHHHHDHDHQHIRHFRHGRRSTPEKLRDHLRSPFRGNFHSLNSVLGPVMLSLLITFTVPCAIIAIVSLSTQFRGGNMSYPDFSFRFAFLFAALSFFWIFVYRMLYSRLDKLRQILIDAEFVVEEKVENYEPEVKSTAASGEATPVVAVVHGDEADMGRDGDWEDAGVDESDDEEDEMEEHWADGEGIGGG